MDESNTLIDNSEVGELVHDNSQWHPGFSALGSVPGVLPAGTATPATAQATEITTADPDLEMDDQADDETDEEMDEIDGLDDEDDEDSPDENEETALGAAVTVGGALAVDPTLDAADVGQLLSNEDITSDDDDSDLPDLEDDPMAEQTGQPAPEGKGTASGHEYWLANSPLRSGARALEELISKLREKHRSFLGHHTRQDLSEFHRPTFQPTTNRRQRHTPVSRHSFRRRPQTPPARFIPQPGPLPTSIEPKNAARLPLPKSNGTSQHDRPDPRTRRRRHRKPSRSCGHLDPDKVGGAEAIGV